MPTDPFLNWKNKLKECAVTLSNDIIELRKLGQYNNALEIEKELEKVHAWIEALEK